MSSTQQESKTQIAISPLLLLLCCRSLHKLFLLQKSTRLNCLMQHQICFLMCLTAWKIHAKVQPAKQAIISLRATHLFLGIQLCVQPNFTVYVQLQPRLVSHLQQGIYYQMHPRHWKQEKLLEAILCFGFLMNRFASGCHFFNFFLVLVCLECQEHDVVVPSSATRCSGRLFH